MEPVSIIMKVWNASRHVKLCLETLLENTRLPYQLIIVDNGSKRRLVEYLRQKAQVQEHIHLIENSTNHGPGYANRQGCEVAKHRFVCLIDSDVLVPPGWLERLSEDFGSSPDVKIMSAMQHEENITYPFQQANKNSRQVWYEVEWKNKHLSPLEQFNRYSQGLSVEAFDTAIRSANPTGIKLIESPPDFLSSSCALVDLEFVNELGGIASEAFRGYGSEDVDLCWRIGEAGGGVAKTDAVYVHHFQGSSLEDNRLDRLAALQLANRILYDRWSEKLLQIVELKVQEQGLDPLVYLERHFIFPALAQHTSFIDDVRSRLNNPDIPEDIVWRPESS